MNLFSLLIIFLAFGGFILALYLRHHKISSGEKLICPLGLDCDSVIHSPYSRFLSIPVEVLGLIYYGTVALSYATFIVLPRLLITPLIFIILGMTIAAFLFSLYLTFIQAFNLRQWCSLCLLSAVICTVIFGLTLVDIGL